MGNLLTLSTCPFRGPVPVISEPPCLQKRPSYITRTPPSVSPAAGSVGTNYHLLELLPTSRSDIGYHY